MPRIGVIGATGAVGRVTIELLRERGYDDVRYFASARSAGTEIDGRVIEEATPEALSAGEFDLRSPGLRQRRVAGHRDKSIERGIELRNAVQASSCHFDRRNVLPPQARAKLNNSFQSRHRP